MNHSSENPGTMHCCVIRKAVAHRTRALGRPLARAHCW